MKKYLIYKIICPIKNSTVYVGYTSNFKKRRRDHRCYTKSTHILEMDQWKLLLKSRNLRCELEIIEDNIDSIKITKEREVYWINKLTQEGVSLFNVAAGGDLAYLLPSHISNRLRNKTFLDMYGEEKAQQIKQSMSNSLKGEKNPSYGGKHITDEWLDKQSKSNSKIPIVVHDKDGIFIGEFINSKECAKFLGVGHSLIRECKSKGWLARHKYKIENKPR